MVSPPSDSGGDDYQDGSDAFATQREFKLPRQPTPHYAVLDLGAGEVVDMNDAGEVLIVNLIYEEEVLTDAEYRVWSGGNATALPAGNNTFDRQWYRLDEAGTAHGWDAIEELPIRAPAGDWANVTTLSGGCVTALLPVGANLSAVPPADPVYADRAGNDYFCVTYTLPDGENPWSFVYNQMFRWAANGTLSLVEGPVLLSVENTVAERSFPLATSGNHTLALRQYDFDFASAPEYYNGYTVELRLNGQPIAGTQRLMNRGNTIDTLHMDLSSYFRGDGWRYAFDPAGLLAQWGDQTVVALPAAVRTDEGANPAAPNLAYQAAPAAPLQYMTLPADPRNKATAAQITGLNSLGLMMNETGSKLSFNGRESPLAALLSEGFLTGNQTVTLMAVTGESGGVAATVETPAAAPRAVKTAQFEIWAYPPESRAGWLHPTAPKPSRIMDTSKNENLQILVNDDNNQNRPIYPDNDATAFHVSPVGNGTPYPRDCDDETLANFDRDVFRLVLPRLPQTTLWSGATGAVTLSTSAPDDIRFFFSEEPSPTATPTTNATFLSAANMTMDLANTTGHPLAKVKEGSNDFVILYAEGVKANSNITISLEINATVVEGGETTNYYGKTNVCVKIIEPRAIHLRTAYNDYLLNEALMNGGQLSLSQIKTFVSNKIRTANAIRTPRYGPPTTFIEPHPENVSDQQRKRRSVLVPVVFRVQGYLYPDAEHPSWLNLDENANGATQAVWATQFDPALNMYICNSIADAGGLGPRGLIILPVSASSSDAIPHEWLHSFAVRAKDQNHVCIDGNLMVNAESDPCTAHPDIQRGGDVNESQRDAFVNDPMPLPAP